MPRHPLAPSASRAAMTVGASFASRVTLAVSASLAITCALTGAAWIPAASAASKTSPSKTSRHSLLQSRQLWATVDVCNAPDQPDTIGIRGSMPGDGHPADRMSMRFRIQYLEAKTGKWVDLAQGADSGFVAVGTAASAREAGRSFQFAPSSTGTTFTLRGTVVFQWRRAGKLVESVTRPTTPGHKSLAGADPAGFTAAACVIA